MSKLSKCFVFCTALMLISGIAMAQKAAFIDSDKIQQNYSEWVRAQEQFNAELEEWEQEAATYRQELQDMLAEYEKQKLILSADKKAEREAAITAKDQLLQAFTRDISAPGGRAEKRQLALVQPLYEKITAAIEKVAITENYEFVFNSNSLAYAKKELDITEKVLELLGEGE